MKPGSKENMWENKISFPAHTLTSWDVVVSCLSNGFLFGIASPPFTLKWYTNIQFSLNISISYTESQLKIEYLHKTFMHCKCYSFMVTTATMWSKEHTGLKNMNIIIISNPIWDMEVQMHFSCCPVWTGFVISWLCIQGALSNV